MAFKDPETAKQAGKRSGEVRRAKAAIASEVKAKKKFENAAEKMASILIQAALGEEEFSRLEPKDRANFAVKVLEYGVGRPRQVEAQAEEKDAAPQGVSFIVGGPQGDMVPEAARSDEEPTDGRD